MDIFSEEELAANAVTSDVANEDTETAAEQRLRDDAGRFAAKDDEPPVEQQPADATTEDRNRQVPQGALHSERERRKGAEARASEAEANYKAAKEQLDALAAMRAQIAAAKPAEVQAPQDGSELEYLKSRMAEIEGTQHQNTQRHQLQQVEEAESRQLYTVANEAETAYRATQPDYDQAIDHVVQARAKELALYGMHPQQIQQAIADETRDIIRTAVSLGRNPAEMGYQIALSRGYRPDTGGQAPAAASRGAAATVAAVAAARQGSRSLGHASGTTATKDLNAATIAAMDGAEFEALYSTPEGRRMIDAL